MGLSWKIIDTLDGFISALWKLSLVIQYPLGSCAKSVI